MSDYVHNKQVLYPVTKELLEKLNCQDIYELEERFPSNSNFKTEGFVDYEDTGNHNEYLAWKLFHDYGADESDFGRSRFLTTTEQEKYKNIFSQVIPEEFLDPTLFKYVDYCWYNCCKCDDYYVRKDSFEEEI